MPSKPHIISKKVQNKIIINYILGPRVAILGSINMDYHIKFINKENGEVVHESEIKNNMWTNCPKEYFIDWRIQINDDFYDLDLKGQRVLINISSKGLGDTLAWIPYVDEFRKKHNCQVIVSTYWNQLFTQVYKELEFIQPGTGVKNKVAQYNVGYLFDHHTNGDLCPKNSRTIPLQQSASDILGLEYTEIKPRVFIKKTGENEIEGKYVCLATSASAQLKFWNNPNGWQEVVDYLNAKGYKVVVIQKEPTDLINIIDRTGREDINDAALDLIGCDFFIGLASGLTWLAWTLNKPTIMISGFSEDWCEFKHDENNLRVINKEVCHGCWNKPEMFCIDLQDWDLCPFHKGTDKQFECSSTITSDKVIEKINNLCADRVQPGELNSVCTKISDTL